MSSPHIVLLDNHDSFVYNLVDALARFDTTAVSYTHLTLPTNREV